MPDFADRVLELLRSSGGKSVDDLARALGADRQAVLRALNRALGGKVTQDPQYRWWASERAPMAPTPVHKAADSVVARLCGYYLDCVARDKQKDIETWAAPFHPAEAYSELASLPLGDGAHDWLTGEGPRSLVRSARQNRQRQELYLGYPTRLNEFTSRRGRVLRMVQPVLLYPMTVPEDIGEGEAAVDVDWEQPRLNSAALRTLAAGDALNEAIRLGDLLGLGSSPAPPIDELVARLRKERPDWDWREEPDPYDLSSEPPLSDKSLPAGICNRAVLVLTGREQFTKGLEHELRELPRQPSGALRSTALGQWLEGQIASGDPQIEEPPLLEVVPLNEEQREAVRSGLAQRLTVVTGPPGTGKSQVVTALLVNAALRGQKVLLASKNNMAVDVVEARVNALTKRPFLLRTGSTERSVQLTQYLQEVLAARILESDEREFQEARSHFDALGAEAHGLDALLDKVIALRNRVDQVEQEVEPLRKQLGEPLFLSARSLNLDALERQLGSLAKAVDRADRSVQPVLARILWPLLRRGRLKAVQAAIHASRSALDALDIHGDMQGSVAAWHRVVHDARHRLADLKKVRRYFDALSELDKSEPVENLHLRKADLGNRLVRISRRVWEAWVRLFPSRIAPGDRASVQEYATLLTLIAHAGKGGQAVSRETWSRYYQLSPRMAALFPCWAVTNLSTKGRIPLVPGFFDLVVIDEASQCDIASVLPLLFRTKRVVVIGDPKQLTHITQLHEKVNMRLLDAHGLTRDGRAGWSYRNSLYDLASGLCRAGDVVNLLDHYRSHADIIEFSNKEFYDDQLRIVTRYEGLKRPSGRGAAVRWVDVAGEASRPPAGSAVNRTEAEAVLGELRRLALHEDYQGTIGVVSPFRAQANLIKEMVDQDRQLTAALAKAAFLADTAHGFQGDERDVILFSPVVSPGVSKGALDFLENSRDARNVFNVAVTRARSALVVVGNHGAALQGHVKYLKLYANYVDGRTTSGDAPPPTGDAGPDYPWVPKPEAVSDWERLLYIALYAAGIRPVAQYPVDNYVLDFAVFSGNRRLDIEVDGEHYHRAWHGELRRRDQLRNYRLIELGWDVKRFWVYQVRDDLQSCVGKIAAWVEETKRAGTNPRP